MPVRPHRPNIILILSDDQGYGDLGVFGNPDLRTPHIDRLALEGVRLTQHYSGSPICAPARAALLTGRYNHRVGALSVESNRGLDRIALDERTIADCFKRAGYATGMVGKWHNGLHDMRYHPNSRGFDEFCGFLNGGMDYWYWIIEANSRPRRSDGTYLTDLFTDEAISFVRRHEAEPFFLYLAYNAPHGPLQAPAEDLAVYTEMGRFTEAVSLTYAMIRRMDTGVGRILDELDRRGLADNTLVLFTSDNGPVLLGEGEASQMRYNGPFRGMKYDVLEGGIRVPALLRWPAGLPAGAERHTMVHFCDWLPTLMAAAGVGEAPGLPLDGVNMLPALRGDIGNLNPQRFWQFNRYDPAPHCNAAMRDGDWKLYWSPIPEAMRKLRSDNAPYQENFRQPHTLMAVSNPPVARSLPAPAAPALYNIAVDPYESMDLAEQEPHRLAAMRLALENWFDQVETERRQRAEESS
ncbi:MAG: arylsulfatase [Planctomycetes bacterium]|nr:arylsulfatase [Planctomycetota bacterium]